MAKSEEEVKAFIEKWDATKDLRGTKEMVCPFCRKELSHSNEYADYGNEGERDCGECGETFVYERTVIITYDTYKPEDSVV